MTPEEALDKATELLLSQEYSQIVSQALLNAKDVSIAAATVVAPIILRMMQDGEIPEEELLGSDQGDGIAIYLLAEVFEIAAEAGLIPGGPSGDSEEPEEEAAEGGMEEVPPEARQMAEQAVQLLAQMLQEGGQAMTGAAPPAAAPQGPPAPAGLMQESAP